MKRSRHLKTATTAKSRSAACSRFRLGMIRGQSAPEVEAVYERILTLTGQVGNVPHEIYFGLWNFYASRGKLLQARDLGQQRLAYGEASGDAESRILGLYTSAAADLFLGNLEQARSRLRTAPLHLSPRRPGQPGDRLRHRHRRAFLTRRHALAPRPAGSGNAEGRQSDRAGPPFLTVHPVGNALVDRMILRRRCATPRPAGSGPRS